MAGNTPNIGGNNSITQTTQISTEVKNKGSSKVFRRFITFLPNAIKNISRKSSDKSNQPEEKLLSARDIVITGSQPLVAKSNEHSAETQPQPQVAKSNEHSAETQPQQYTITKNNLLNAGLTLAREGIASAQYDDDDKKVLTKNLQNLIDTYDEQLQEKCPKKVTDDLKNELDNLSDKIFAELIDAGLEAEITSLRFKEIKSGELEPDLSHPFNQAQLKPNSLKELLKIQKIHINSAINILKNNKNENDKRYEKLEEHLNYSLKELEFSVALNGDKEASKKEQKAVKEGLPKELAEQLVSVGFDKSEAKSALRNAYVEQLNSRDWAVFDNNFSVDGIQYQSQQTPASKIRVSDGEIFINKYGKGGVSSADTTNTGHATNLWRSDFSIAGKSVFTGIRHGIHSPFGHKNKKEREAGANKKAEESIIAALASQPELYNKALEAGALEAGANESQAPTLITTSTSLVTTGLGSSKENKLQKAQNKAFRKLVDGSQPVKIKIPASDGETRTVAFNLKQARFNIPVNAGGVGIASGLTGGRVTQHQMNSKAMDEMLGGTKGQIGGFVGDRLGELNKKLITLQNNTDTAQNLNSDIKALETEINIINNLATQVRTIYLSGKQHHEHHDAYKLATRVALLTSKIGAVPLYNCKSGKDRTGMLDAEIKFMAACIERDGEVPTPGNPLEGDDQTLFQSILLESGNHEIQESNVGVRGYKTDHVDSIQQRAGDKWLEVLGAAYAAGS